MAPIKKHLETDLENVHSLPNIEEARTQNIIAGGGNKYSGKKKRTIALIVIVVAVIATAVGFTIAGTQNKRANNEANSLASNENQDDDTAIDDQENDDEERLVQVQALLIDSGMSSLTQLRDSTTPQYLAAVWISNEDEQQLDIPESMEEDDAYVFVQRYVMAVFYYALGGDDWTHDEVAFLSGEDTCDWNFDLSLRFPVPGSDDVEFDYGVSCWDEDAGEYGDVVTWIFMPDNNLVGSLPSEIGELEELSHLSLFSNKIVGSIPESFQKLEFLNFWAMESNDISGSLPSWIGDLESLEYLALGNNTLSGGLPNFANSNLIQLSLDSNNFDGSIDSLNEATLLEAVYLNNNQFSGAITEDTWRALIDSKLSIADLSSNMLSGSFPAYFYWLEEIDLSDNKLDGIIAEPIDDGGDDFPVTTINLADNNLKGHIPTNIDLLVSLVGFDVSGNELTGAIPTQLGALPGLQSLYLSYNSNLELGPIPDLRGCQELTEVSMASTNRNGYIGEWFGSALTDLELLDLHSNQLTATIPTNLGSLENLSVLMLNRNKLTGVVPSELGNLEYLEILYLDHNSLSGSMGPICEGPADELEFLVVDSEVEDCDGECCSETCDEGDDSCNDPDDTPLVKLDYNLISRESYVYGEDFKLAEVDSPDE